MGTSLGGWFDAFLAKQLLATSFHLPTALNSKFRVTGLFCACVMT